MANGNIGHEGVTWQRGSGVGRLELTTCDIGASHCPALGHTAPDLMGIQGLPPSPCSYPHPMLPSPTGCINSASLASTFNSPERSLCETKGMLDKKRNRALHLSKW